MMDRNHRFSEIPSNHEPITMTPEELAFYKNCSKEAFLKRGLPYGSFVTGATYCALRAGYLKPNPKYGYRPALIIAACVGSLIGSISYKAVCLQKVMDLPNSQLKQKLGASLKKYQPPTGLSGLEPPADELNIDTQGPMVSDLQIETYQSTNDFDGFTGVNTDGDQPPINYDTFDSLPKFSGALTSYDELRQRNRDDYMRSQSTRQPVRPDTKQYARPQAPITDGSLPFDQDRVPQYQLVD